MKRASWIGWVVPKKGDIFRTIFTGSEGGWVGFVFENPVKAKAHAKTLNARAYRVRISVVR